MGLTRLHLFVAVLQAQRPNILQHAPTNQHGLDAPPPSDNYSTYSEPSYFSTNISITPSTCTTTTMVVTRRTPVVPQPPPARHFAPPAAQRPPRTSLSKDTACVSGDVTSNAAVASLSDPSNGNKDHRNGLVSICLSRKTKLFEPLPSDLTLFCPLFLSAVSLRMCSMFCILWVGT